MTRRRTKPTDLERAIALATDRHAGQKDKAGAPYVLHPLRVMLRLTDPTEQVAAVLHDVVEDTRTTLDELREQGFPPRVVELVGLLTKRKNGQDKVYYNRLAKDPAASRIKLADLSDNLDVTRLPRLTDKAAGRLRKYLRWRDWLLARQKQAEPSG